MQQPEPRNPSEITPETQAEVPADRPAHFMATASFIVSLAMIAAWGWLGARRPDLARGVVSVLSGLGYVVNGVGIILGIWGTLRDETCRTLGLIGAACNLAQPIFILFYSAAFPLAN